MSEGYVIGVDHGYAAMKTVHGSFPSGLVAYEHEPYTQKNVLEYGGTYYVVGSGRQPLQKDKTRTEDYYLLTLAAIAREIADITIAADSLWELVRLRQLAMALMRRIRNNYRFVIGFNGALIGLGVTGILPPTTSAMLHNLSTLGVSLHSMTALPQKKQD